MIDRFWALKEASSKSAARESSGISASASLKISWGPLLAEGGMEEMSKYEYPK
jgi:hypothetical protein